MKDAGKVVYDSYRAAVGNNDHNGRYMPAFNDLPTNHQDAWHGAARTLLEPDEPDKPSDPNAADAPRDEKQEDKDRAHGKTTAHAKKADK